ncbi:2'-5' RNA ligase family protein [Fulvivirga sp.]|uniref:2'-5' RNA ligase family protein n=1 Tax=Fulvivirga sp. TaxID=1931237 RepID=UPI0032ED13FC
MKNSNEANLYFLAVIPPEPILGECQAHKNQFYEKYNSKASLNSPPHVTVHMPFKLRESKEDQLVEVISRGVNDLSNFSLQLDGYDHFGQRVIYVKVVDSEPLLALFLKVRKVMKVNFNIFNADYKNRGFNPHITLAFRDLKREAFKEAWPEFEKATYDKSFEVQSLVLLKHDGEKWHQLKEFRFKC